MAVKCSSGSKSSGTKTRQRPLKEKEKPGGAHLQHGRRQVHRCEDGRQCGVATVHQVDRVEEDEVTRNNQQEEHLGRAMIGSWREKKKE